MLTDRKDSKAMVSVNTDTIVDAVDLVIPTYLKNYAYRIGSKQYKAAHKNGSATMQSEQSTLCDMYVEQWEMGIHSALRDSAMDKYPHFSTIKCLLNYILNDHKPTDFGLVSEVFSRLLSYHPPSKTSMSEYYGHILQDHYALINDKKKEDQQFFWVLLDVIRNLPEETTNPICYQSHPAPMSQQENQVPVLADLTGRKGKAKSNTKSVVFFNDLNESERRKRSSFCLEFVCDILEDDLVAWLRDYETSVHAGHPLISRLVWPDSKQEGHITPSVQKIIALQRGGLSGRDALSDACERLLTMVAEVVRIQDRSTKTVYPFLGTFSTDLARELGMILHDRFKGNEKVMIAYLNRLKPAWLRLLTVSRVLGDLAGFHCLPEMLSAVTVMEHLELTFKAGRQLNRMKENLERPPADPTLVAKFAKLKSVNTLFRTGLSRLHMACHEHDVEAVRALLTFPTLDLNLKDPSGWTALHVAAGRSSDACVKELLTYMPRVGDVQRRVDTRARGPGNYTPLMRAVEAEDAKICSMLLKHTGSVLLEDITDDNETALDLCKDEEVRKILKHYHSVKVETVFSKKEMDLATGNLPLVASLCCSLVLSYMIVHCTWDVYHAVKKYSKQCHISPESVPRLLCEYSRYHRDFKTNLPKVRQMVMKLRKVPQLASAIDVFHCIVSLNKG